MWLPLRLFIACLVYPKLFNRVALLLETAKAHDKNGMLYKIGPWQYRTGLASNPLKDCLSLIKDNMGNETPLTTSDGIKWAPSSESIPLKFHMERHLASAQIFLSIHSSSILSRQKSDHGYFCTHWKGRLGLLLANAREMHWSSILRAKPSIVSTKNSTTLHFPPNRLE